MTHAAGQFGFNRNAIQGSEITGMQFDDPVNKFASAHNTAQTTISWRTLINQQQAM